MFGIAVISGRSDGCQVGRLSTRTRDHLCEVALVGLACAAMSFFVAAKIRLGGSYPTAYLVLGLALPVLCVTALPSFTPFGIVARLAPRKRHRHGPSFALRPTGHADGLLSIGPGVGRVLADFRR
jgi:hypothetical protein